MEDIRIQIPNKVAIYDEKLGLRHSGRGSQLILSSIHSQIERYTKTFIPGRRA